MLRDRSRALCQPMIDRILFTTLFFFYELEFSICSKPRERASSVKRIDKKNKNKTCGSGKGCVESVWFFAPPPSFRVVWTLSIPTLYAWPYITTTYKYMHKESCWQSWKEKIKNGTERIIWGSTLYYVIFLSILDDPSFIYKYFLSPTYL